MAGSLRAVTGKPNTWELRVFVGATPRVECDTDT
jgi:hypothetical protein